MGSIVKILTGVPETVRQLLNEGYELTNPYAQCRGCFAPLGWWLTPRGIYVPFEEVGAGKVILHYLQCPTLTQACRDRLAQYETEL